MRREESIEKLFLLQHFVRGDVDPHHQLKPKDRLAQGRADGNIDDLRTLATHAGPDSVGCFTSQTIQRCHRRVVGKERGHVRLDVAEGVGVGQPAQNELRWR